MPNRCNFGPDVYPTIVFLDPMYTQPLHVWIRCIPNHCNFGSDVSQLFHLWIRYIPDHCIFGSDIYINAQRLYIWIRCIFVNSIRWISIKPSVVALDSHFLCQTTWNSMPHFSQHVEGLTRNSPWGLRTSIGRSNSIGCRAKHQETLGATLSCSTGLRQNR